MHHCIPTRREDTELVFVVVCVGGINHEFGFLNPGVNIYGVTLIRYSSDGGE